MRVAEGKESPHPAERELTFQWNECGWKRKERLHWQPREEPEAEGTAGMDDRRNDGRGAWMASEGAGHGSGPTASRRAQRTNLTEAIEVETPNNERCP